MNTLSIKSIDVMKLVKDNINSQINQAQINSAVAACVKANANTIAISPPMNNNAEMIAHGNKPSPNIIEDYTKQWTDAIHSAGLHVLFRGTLCEIEGIYNFPYNVGSSRLPAGTAQTAQHDGGATLLGKIFTYIVSNPGLFADGDYFAPVPEGTNVMFNANTAFVPDQPSYMSFMKDLVTISQQAFQAIGKKVNVGYTTNNYTEINSGYLQAPLFDQVQRVVIDDYATPSIIDQHLRGLSAKFSNKYPIFHQEWGLDYSVTDPIAEIQTFVDTTAKRVADGVQNAFNYWGGWTGALESIFDDDGKGGFVLNTKGQTVAKLFAPATTQPTPAPTPTPQPTPTSTPLPAFTFTASSTVTSDGKGNITITVKQ